MIVRLRLDGAFTVPRIERDLAVPMRDGVVLRADVYRPEQGGPYPVLVMRTPYGKRGKKFGLSVNDWSDRSAELLWS